MASHAAQSEERFFERTLKRHYSKLTKRGLEPDEACAVAVQLATRPGPQHGLEEEDDVPPPAKANRIPALDALHEAIKTAKEDGNIDDLVELLDSLFSSPNSVVLPFVKLKPADEGKDPGDARPIPDIQAMHAFYTALQPLSMKHKEVEQQLASGGRRMRRWISGWVSGDRKRVPVAAVCLLNPILDNPHFHHMVTKPFLLVLADSTREVKAQLQWLLKGAPADAFRKIVQMIQQYITMAIFAAPWRRVPPSGVQAAVRLLAVLWRSNQDAALIPHTEFYNDAVNSRDCPVTVKEDHARWRATKGREFSFCKYPFIYDPAAKTELLYCENYHQQYAEVEGAVVRAVLGGQHMMCPYLVLRVRRGPQLVQDTLEQINRAKHNHTLKKPLKVQFVGEEGVDEGGVQKELFQLLLRELFNPDYGMFTYDTTTHLHWFRPSNLTLEGEFELIGILIGMAIYNGHLLDLSFPLLLYRLLLRQTPGLQHLHELYPDVAASMHKLLEYEGDVADLGLCFEVMTEKAFGEYVTTELVPGGGDVEVTTANREEYVRLYVRHLLQGSVSRQQAAFLKGFHRMCSGDTLDFLLPEELEQLVCGSRKLDMAQLQRTMQYEGGYTRHSKAVRWFWEVVHKELSTCHHRKLLSFMTGTERVPLKGLAHLSPAPVIARAGPHSSRLPSAHTCFNHLLLPDYQDKDTLRNRLHLAINNAEGFGLI